MNCVQEQLIKLSTKCYLPSIISQINVITASVPALNYPTPRQKTLNNKKIKEGKKNPRKIRFCTIYFSEKCHLKNQCHLLGAKSIK